MVVLKWHLQGSRKRWCSNCCFGYYTLDHNIWSSHSLTTGGWGRSTNGQSFAGVLVWKKKNKFLCRKSYFRIVRGTSFYWRHVMEETRTGFTLINSEKRETVDSLESTCCKYKGKSMRFPTFYLKNQKEDTSYLPQVILDDNGVFQDFDSLDSLDRRNAALSKAVSLSEKLVVVLADLISDYLVLDMLFRMNSLEQVGEFLLGALVAYFLADLFSGIYHWASANYLSESFRWSRNALRYYRWHVERPEEIVQMNFFDNVYSHCLIVIPFLLLTAYLRSSLSLFVESVVVFLLACIAIWPELHKWSHMEGSSQPPPVIVRTLQQLGLILTANDHKGQHTTNRQVSYPMEKKRNWLSRDHFHVATTSYSTVSGHWNWILDSIEFYRKLEYIIYLFTGVEPRLWSQDPQLRKRFITNHNDKRE